MKRLGLVLLVVGALGGGLSADPLKPVVEVRVKAVADLLPTVEYVGGLVGQADAAQQFAGVLKQFAANEKGFDGVDLNRPIGLYADLAQTLDDTPVVLMLPIADEETALDAVKTKLNSEPKKGDAGVYSVAVPGVPGTVYLRFADKYAYVTIRSDKVIEPAKLIAPKDFFADKPKEAVSVVAHINRIPTDVKKIIYGKLELHLQENNSKLAATPVQKLFNDFLADVTVDAVKTTLLDGDKLTLALDVDPKADDWKLTVGLTPKAGTTLEKTLAGFADRESVAAGVAWVKNPLSNSGVNVQLPPETTKKFAELMDKVAKQAVQDAKEVERPVVEKVFDAILPTLKAGDFQLGALATPPAGTGGKLGGVFALKTVKGVGIEQIAKLGALMIPKETGGLQADVESVGERKFHKLTLSNQGENPFDIGTMWVLTSDDLIASATGAKADPLKALVAAKPVKTPMLFTEISFARAAALAEKGQTPEAVQKVVLGVFGDGKPDGKDTMKLVLSGGKKLDLSFSIKGKAVALLAALDRAKKGE